VRSQHNSGYKHKVWNSALLECRMTLLQLTWRSLCLVVSLY
jgi:hypothetical protein